MKKLFALLLLFVGLCLPSLADDIKSVCANHILVGSELEAIKIKQEIKSFEDFTICASIYSECPSGKKSGDLGNFSRGQMVPEFERAAFNGPVEQVIGPVRTQFGYHLIWVRCKN